MPAAVSEGVLRRYKGQDTFVYVDVCVCRCIFQNSNGDECVVTPLS